MVTYLAQLLTVAAFGATLRHRCAFLSNWSRLGFTCDQFAGSGDVGYLSAMTGIRFFCIMRECPQNTVEHPPKDVLYELVKYDLSRGLRKDAERLLKDLEADEHYEACAGVRDALLDAPSK